MISLLSKPALDLVAQQLNKKKNYITLGTPPAASPEPKQHQSEGVATSAELHWLTESLWSLLYNGFFKIKSSGGDKLQSKQFIEIDFLYTPK